MVTAGNIVYFKTAIISGKAGSGNCGHVSYSVHMLLYNHSIIGKYATYDS